MPDYRTPGVYIEELPATGPIAGVGTSTPAFLGAADRGPIGTPLEITNWTRFREEFGSFLSLPGFYLAHAVRGFFQNGGTVAQVVRVGTAVRSFLELDDRKNPGPPGKAIRVEAKKEGLDGDNIRVEVKDDETVTAAAGVVAVRATAPIVSAAGTTVTLQNAAHQARFRPGDWITIETTAERSQILRYRGTDELTLATTLTTSHGNANPIRIADLAAGQKSFRILDGLGSFPSGIEPGTVLHIDRSGVVEDIVVDAVSGGFVTVADPGLANPYSMAAGAAVTFVTREFELIFTKPGAMPPVTPQSFPNLSMDSRHSRYFAHAVDAELVTVRLPDTPSAEAPPDNRPDVLAATPLANGADDNKAMIGMPHYASALAALRKVDDVQIVCVPDRQDTGVQGAVRDHCEQLGDRIAVLDVPRNASMAAARTQRAALESKRGYAAVYYPWIRIIDPNSITGEDTILVPPSGYMAGIYARVDNERGVHKAPANELIRGTADVETRLDDVEQGQLNVENVNVLRVFPNQVRPIVWGARTTAPPAETPWRYINVRRLFLFVEESIQEGIQWAVFEPNDLTLWKRLDRVIRDFLTRVWRSGALFGATAEEAFYVKIDEELNPPSVRALGQIIIEIGIAPVRPAEFVIVRIGMWEGGSEVSES